MLGRGLEFEGEGRVEGVVRADVAGGGIGDCGNDNAAKGCAGVLGTPRAKDDFLFTTVPDPEATRGAPAELDREGIKRDIGVEGIPNVPSL